jgi:predicted ATP-dependent protease
MHSTAPASPPVSLAPAQLCLQIDPTTLGFAHTGELQDQPLPWIGQERAAAAVRFGLGMQQPDYHLFVLGELGSGRSSLLTQAMHEAAALRPVPPDLCYLHHFDKPERPHALRLPAGQGKLLRQGMDTVLQTLPSDIAKRLQEADYRADNAALIANYDAAQTEAFAALEIFASQRQFALNRDNGHMVFTLLDAQGEPQTPDQASTLPPPQRAALAESEQALRAEIARVLSALRPIERAHQQACTDLRQRTIAPLLAQVLGALHSAVCPSQAEPNPSNNSAKLTTWLARVQKALLDQLALFLPLNGDVSDGADISDDNSSADAASNSPGNKSDQDDEDDRKDALDALLAQCRIHLAVDNNGRSAAPVIIEDNPQLRSLFGSVEVSSDEDTAPTDLAAIHAGNLLKAHGGFLMLHLRDVASAEGLWERLRRFLRCARVQQDDTPQPPGHASRLALRPEPVEVDVKIVLIGSVQEYYALQAADPEVAQRFRTKVDFAESFRSTLETRRATGVFIAHIARKRGLPDFSAAAVARLLEQSHREADDQTRQSALFAQTESLAIESAALCRARAGTAATATVEAIDIDAALQARTLRHNYTEQRLHESIADGERLITLHGTHVGQINALTQIDQGDYRFGFPVRITAHAFAGHEGLLNIEREVEMSGPIHDKGVLILHSYLTALFGHIAPLALNASVVFEQEYSGVEGDSASCAELYALLSALSGVPLAQGIAVTGALNQHGQVLPVGGINEKIEGWFKVCEAAGLDGTQGALIPARNLQQLMLDRHVIEAVAAGRFHIYTAGHVSDGMAILTSQAPEILAHSVLARAEQTLRTFRRACQVAGHTRLRSASRLRENTTENRSKAG